MSVVLEPCCSTHCSMHRAHRTAADNLELIVRDDARIFDHFDSSSPILNASVRESRNPDANALLPARGLRCRRVATADLLGLPQLPPRHTASPADHGCSRMSGFTITAASCAYCTMPRSAMHGSVQTRRKECLRSRTALWTATANAPGPLSVSQSHQARALVSTK